MGIGHYAGLIRGGHKDYYYWQRTENGQTRNSLVYTTTAFTTNAINWIKEQKQLWFLWRAYTAAHLPLHVPPSNHLRCHQLENDEAVMASAPLPYYLAALEALDFEIGRILSNLSKNVRKNTLIIFMGDNGTLGRIALSPSSRRKA